MKLFILTLNFILIFMLPINAEILVKDAFAITSMPNAKSGAIFMKIYNNGSYDDQLLSVSTEVSKMSQLHAHKMDGEVMKMVHVQEGFKIDAQSHISLERGGNHIMLMGISKVLKKNELFFLTLKFKNAGIIEIQVPYHGAGQKKIKMKHNDEGEGSGGDY
jgi:periplasmic copper chaperone A